MKIVQLVTARQFRGAEIFASQLSGSLAQRGVEVLYVSLYRATGGEFTPAIPWIDLLGQKGKTINVSLLRKLSECLSTYQPDIVQANAGDTLKYAVLVKFFSGLDYAIVFRNASIVSAYLKNPIKRWMQGLLLRRVSFVVSVSEASRNDLVTLYPFLQHKIEVVPVAVNTGESSVSDGLTDSFFSNKPVFVHIGGFTFEKNHIGLTRIFKRFFQQQGKGTLLLVGEGPLRKEIEEHVAQHNLNIISLGNRRDVPQLLSQADCLVLPSIIEGLPAVILESFWQSTPVVAFNVGGIAEVLNSKTGWLIAAGDEEGFVSGMTEAVREDQVVRERTAFARNLVATTFTIDKITGKFIGLYHRIKGE